MAITASTVIQTEFGPFDVRYHKIEDKELVSFSRGDLTAGEPVVRFHSACLFGEAFHSRHCDCAQQLTETMKTIAANGSGVIIYIPYEEGRGIGLENKIRAMEVERTEGVDTVEAFKKLGFDADPRNFRLKVKALEELDIVRTVKSFSGNPKKRDALKNAGFTIQEEINIVPADLSDIAAKERAVKQEKMGYSQEG